METKDVIEIATLFILFIMFIVWLILIIHSIKLSHRLNNHVLKKDNNDNISIIDKLITWYQIRKTEIADGILEMSLKSKKAIDKHKQIKEINGIIDAFACALIFVTLYILLSIFYIKEIDTLSFIMAFILGFILPGLVYLFNHEIEKKEIEKNLLKAITIINNNLQANKSIKEALIDTKDKINGKLKIELESVINDLEHGLSLEVAFKRMKTRCEVADLTYLTTTLSILSKTGGNTKEVFNYLESLFQIRKKLSQELDATIASSKLVYIILSVLPIIVLIGMILIYDGYLTLYITSPLGNLLGFSELLLYLIYILTIKKIMMIDKY